MIGILWNVLFLVGSSMSKIGIFLLSQSGYTAVVPIQGGECHHVTTAIFFCVAETQKEKSFHISSSGITQCDTFRHSISSSVLETQPCLFLENSRPGFFSHFLTYGKFGLHLFGLVCAYPALFPWALPLPILPYILATFCFVICISSDSVAWNQ